MSMRTKKSTVKSFIKYSVYHIGSISSGVISRNLSLTAFVEFLLNVKNLCPEAAAFTAAVLHNHLPIPGIQCLALTDQTAKRPRGHRLSFFYNDKLSCLGFLSS